MKKVKKDIINKSKDLKKENFIPRISLFFVSIFFTFFLFLVLNNYYKNNPLNFKILEIYYSLREFEGEVNVIFVLRNFLLNVVLIFLIIFSALNLGWVITRIFRLNFSEEEKFLFSVSFGIGVLVIVLFFVGILGQLYKYVVLIILFLSLIIGLLFKFFRKENIFSEILWIREIFYKKTFFEKICLILVFWLASIVIIGCLSPEIFYDSLVYHLAKPNFWIQNNKIMPDKSYMMSFFFPGNMNLLYVIGLYLNDETICKFLHFGFNILTCLTLYVMGKKFFDKKVGFLAGILFFTIPYVGILSYRSAVEMPLAFFETLGFFTFIVWLKENDFRWLVISGLNYGLGIGTKYTTFYGWVGILICIFFLAIFEKKSFKYFIKSVSIFIFFSIIISLPWFLHNYIYTGNPLYPYFWSFFGYVKPRATYDPTTNFYSLKEWVKDFFNIIKYFWSVPMGKHEEAFIGINLLIFSPLFFLMESSFKQIKYFFIYILVYWFIWGIAHKGYVRYFVPALPVLSFLCAAYFYNFDSKFINKIVKIVLMIIFVSNIFFVMQIQKFSNDCLGVVLGLQSRYDYLNTLRPTYPNPYYAVADWVNKNLSKDVLINFLGEIRSFYFERKSVFFNFADYVPIVIWSENSGSEDELYKRIKEEKVTHILVNPLEIKRLGQDVIDFSPKSLKIFSKFWNKYVREVYRDIADISIPSQGIVSMKKQHPEWWAGYSSDIRNYVYLYEIMSEEEVNKPHPIPYNFFLEPHFYSPQRWEKLRPVVEEIMKNEQ